MAVPAVDGCLLEGDKKQLTLSPEPRIPQTATLSRTTQMEASSYIALYR